MKKKNKKETIEIDRKDLKKGFLLFLAIIALILFVKNIAIPIIWVTVLLLNYLISEFPNLDHNFQFLVLVGILFLLTQAIGFIFKFLVFALKEMQGVLK